MNSIFELQRRIQQRYAALRGMQDPQKISTRGEAVEYIQQMHVYLNEELAELLREIDPNNTVRKPWKTDYVHDSETEYNTNHRTKQEAMDALCFMMNICLAAGLTPENIEEVYASVHRKNLERLDDSY